ncbi:MAG: hypothetical protein K1060chlam4_01034 [Candidatus Anoxychlamydiales bacterium]|nr:hypothetical protein [Candidatus Anoxychlamydiales bacterium]
MASVSLPPRTYKEWFQANHICSQTDPEKILAICSEMETQLGQNGIEGDKGELGALVAKILNFTHDEDEDDHRIKKVNLGSEQDFATAYRYLETRFVKLSNQEIELTLYLRKGVPEVKQNPNYSAILLKSLHLESKINEIRLIKRELSVMFDKLQFVSYNRIFQSAANVFIFAPFQKVSSIFKTKKIETLALASFVAIAGYSVMTNTNTSFLVKATVPLFFMYIGHLFSKTYHNLNTQPLQPQTVSFTMSPPSSPRR